MVLGPVAVAQVLEALKPELAGPDGLLAVRRGERVVAPSVNLSDSPRFPGTLPRSYDAEGVPRQPVPLIQDGVAHRFVSDTAAGGSTGHATRPGHAEPWPDHLVLVGGGARTPASSPRPIAVGLFIPAFLLTERGWLLDGAQLIEAGEPTWPVIGVAEVDPVAVLGGTEALTAGQRLVPTEDDSALTIGATICPSLRARAGVTISRLSRYRGAMEAGDFRHGERAPSEPGLRAADRPRRGRAAARRPVRRRPRPAGAHACRASRGHPAARLRSGARPAAHRRQPADRPRRWRAGSSRPRASAARSCSATNSTANRMVQRSRLRSISEPPVVPPATPTPKAPDMPASLPECSSTRKIRTTAMKTWTTERTVYIGCPG